jgi:hypothetical protein
METENVWAKVDDSVIFLEEFQEERTSLPSVWSYCDSQWLQFCFVIAFA